MHRFTRSRAGRAPNLRVPVLLAGLALAATACTVGRPPPRGGPVPTFTAALEDSTTLWLLTIDPASVGVSGWTPGAWATYEVGVRRGPGSPIRQITYKVLETDSSGTWIEVRDAWTVVGGEERGAREEGGERGERAQPGPRMPLPPARVEQWLLPFGPVERARMLEQIVLDPDSGVRRGAYVRRPEPKDSLQFPGTWLWVGAEELQTPKGGIQTHHYRKSATNVWVSEAVPPIGLVRAAGRGPLVSLVDWGSEGAVSSIPLEHSRPGPLP